MQFLEETKMLNYQSVGIQKLINEKRWKINGYAVLSAEIKQDYRYGQTQNLKTFLSTVRNANRKV